MAGAADIPTRERRIASIAARQYSLVTDQDLMALGLGRGAIRHRLAAGRLFRMQPGVYAVGHPRTDSRSRWLAAVLTCRDGALLSHTTAADIWGVLPSARPRAHVTVPHGRGRGRRDIILHRVRQIHPDDAAERDRIPVTSLHRTLLDLAEVVPPRRLARAFEEADRMRLLDLRTLRAVCDRSPGRRGLKALRHLIADHTRGAGDTRSPLEVEFAEFCRQHDLPLPAFNVSVEGYTVDAMWPGRSVVVELDGWDTHHTRRSFERDRIRDADLQAAGHRPIRLTSRRLADDGQAAAATLRRLGVG